MDNSKIPEERVRQLYEAMIDYIAEMCPAGEEADTLESIGFTKQELFIEGFDCADDEEEV